MHTRLLTAKAAQRIDLEAERTVGISTLALMENAGAAVARFALQMCPSGTGTVVFCGKGNNGGDGFVAVRHLLAKGVKPDVYLACGLSDVRNEARTNLDILRKLKQKIIVVTEKNVSRIPMQKYGCIIDALLGVGLSGPVRGIYRDIIGLINASQARVLSVDIPSGLDATSGRVWGACVRADTSVTFIAKKRGMVIGSGPRCCGRVVVADLGVPLYGRGTAARRPFKAKGDTE